jgi:hypothetical protein
METEENKKLKGFSVVAKGNLRNQEVEHFFICTKVR